MLPLRSPLQRSSSSGAAVQVLWQNVRRGAGLALLLCLGLPGLRALAQGAVPGTLPSAPKPAAGTITGTVTDSAGALVPRAKIALRTGDLSVPQVMQTDDAGDFTFSDVPPGHFQVVISAQGFQDGILSGDLHPGQFDDLHTIALTIGEATTEVTVTPLTLKEEAEQDVKAEEQQKVFGIIPNFFVVYKDHPVPLDGRQKLELSLHGIIDPFPFVSSAVVAGIQQAADSLPGYNQGAAGYFKRYGAAYTNFASATMLRDGLFPAVFHQDPRYYYRGYGTKTSRVLYALSTAVVCKGDNGRNQFNYSSILGNLSAGALTNLYYPASSRNGIGVTFENGALSTLGVGAGHVLQEFLFERITKRRGLATSNIAATSNTAPAKP
jgi:hypothetical protein